jgi:hypothetical protein
MRRILVIVVLGVFIAAANSAAAQGGSVDPVSGLESTSSLATAPAQGGGLGPIGGYEVFGRPNPKGGYGPGKSVLTNP